MTDRDISDGELRDLLLGRLGEDQREGIEARLLSDDDLAERAAILEDELAEAYAADTLSSREREIFEGRLLRVPRLQERVACARAFDVLATGRARPAARAPWPRKLWAALRPPPMALAWALASSLLVALGAGIIARQQIETYRREAEDLRAEREVESHASGRTSTTAFVLSPGTSRSEGGVLTLRMPQRTSRVLLVLDLAHAAQDQVYRALLHDSSGAQILALTGLRAVERDGASVLEIQVDSIDLPPGRYELRLEALEGGEARPAGTYIFRTAPPEPSSRP